MNYSDNFDLEKFVDMFDAALNSDNPTVRKCFNNLLTVVALAHAHEKQKSNDGPLRKIINDISALHEQVSTLKTEISFIKTGMDEFERVKYSNNTFNAGSIFTNNTLHK